MKKILEKIEEFATSKKVYITFSVSLLLYNFVGLAFINDWQRNSDYWEHLASIDAFSRNLLNFANPYTVPSTPTHLLTPFHLFWGAVCKAVSVRAFYMLPIVGTVNILLFLIANYVFAKYMLSDKKYALILSLTMLCFWVEPWDWSGFYNLGLMVGSSFFPYWFSLPVAMLVIALYGEKGFESTFSLVIFTLLMSLVFLAHPLMGSFLFLSIPIKVLLVKNTAFRKKLVFLIPVLAGFLISLFWPYFPVLNAVLGSVQHGNSDVWVTLTGEYMRFYNGAIGVIAPSLIGLVFIYKTARSRQLNFVFSGFVIFTSIYVLNFLFLHSGVFARYIIFVNLFLHFSIVMTFVAYKDSDFKFIFIPVFLVLMTYSGFSELNTSAKTIGLLVDIKNNDEIGYRSNTRHFRQYEVYSKFITSEDIVLAPVKVSWVLPGIIGCKVVGVWHSNPFLYDHPSRLIDIKTFFSNSTSSAKKINILKKYKTTHMLIPKEDSYVLGNIHEYLTYVFEDKDNVIFKYKNEYSLPRVNTKLVSSK